MHTVTVLSLVCQKLTLDQKKRKKSKQLKNPILGARPHLKIVLNNYENQMFTLLDI